VPSVNVGEKTPSPNLKITKICKAFTWGRKRREGRRIGELAILISGRKTRSYLRRKKKGSILFPICRSDVPEIGSSLQGGKGREVLSRGLG